MRLKEGRKDAQKSKIIVEKFANIYFNLTINTAKKKRFEYPWKRCLTVKLSGRSLMRSYIED